MLDVEGLERRRIFLVRLAALGALLVLLITSLSAAIRLTNAGLGCADWPRCYGPAQQHGAAATKRARGDSTAIAVARLVHRIAATLALIIIVAMLAACFGSRPVLWREGTAALALGLLALFLAVLGLWTTGARLPAVALGNLLGGFAMLALFWWLRLRSAVGGKPSAHAFGIVRVGAALAIAVLVVQIALGGLVSASFSALGCTTLPDCAGSAWPGAASWDAFDPWRDPLAGGWSANDPAAVAIHMAHRYGALVATVVIVAVALGAWRVGGQLRAPAAAALVLLAGQIALGVSSVLGSLPFGLVLAHNVVAALLLLALVSLAKASGCRPQMLEPRRDR